MADPIIIPIVPDICLSQSNLDLFWSQLNLGFQLIVQTADEELGLSLTLPGIPPIPLLGMPGIRIPRMEAQEIPLRLRRQPGVRGYVGNVYPVSQGGKGVGGKFGFPGFGGFEVEGIPPSMLPGISPSTYTMDWLNRNYQIIAELLAEEGIIFEPVPIPSVDICGGGDQLGGGSSPGAALITELVNGMNQQITNAIEDAVASCFNSPNGFTPLTDAGYFSAIAGTISANVAATTVEGIWTPGGNSQLIFTGYDTTAVNPYTGTAPAQLLAIDLCAGHGARLDYAWEINATGAGQGRMRAALVKVETGGTLTFIDTNDHVQAAGGSSSGSDSLTMAAGTLTGNEAVALFVRINGDGPNPEQGNAIFTYTTLVDLGP